MHYTRNTSRSAWALAAALVACAGSPPELESHRTVQLVLDGQSFAVELTEIEGQYVWEGDIVVDDRLVPELAGDGQVEQGLTVTTNDLLWPGGRVPYTIDPSLPNKARVHEAIAHWQQRTAIRFVPRTTETAYVTFRPATACFANIGRRGGQQFVNLAPYCNRSLTIHEIGHTLGFLHEHTRKDRDKYVRILLGNAFKGTENNFYIRGPGQDLGPYDADSIMHYGSYELSRNGLPTVLRRPDDGLIPMIQNKPGLSPGDLSSLARKYGSKQCAAGDGLYCGGNGVAGNPDTLYRCTGGQATTVKVCSAGCQYQVFGLDDNCHPPGVQCAAGDGFYCGMNGVPGNSNTLYECRSGNVSVARACTYGCVKKPFGFDDGCNPPPTQCELGDGLYCGGNGVIGDASTLFRCTNGTPTPIASCANGCRRMPAGTDDRCN